MQKMGARSLVDLERMSDRLKADDGSTLDATPESTPEGLPRSSRPGRLWPRESLERIAMAYADAFAFGRLGLRTLLTSGHRCGSSFVSVCH